MVGIVDIPVVVVVAVAAAAAADAEFAAGIVRAVVVGLDKDAAWAAGFGN